MKEREALFIEPPYIPYVSLKEIIDAHGLSTHSQFYNMSHCPKGWLWYIDYIFSWLEHNQPTWKDHYYLSQIKEKFNTLRIYFAANSQSNIIDDEPSIYEFENFAAHICQDCGKIPLTSIKCECSKSRFLVQWDQTSQ